MLVAMMPRVHADGEGEGDETTDSHRRWNAVCLHGRPNSSVGSDRLPASIFVESLAESHLDALVFALLPSLTQLSQGFSLSKYKCWLHL